MNHDRAVYLIGDALRGNLNADARSEVLSHAKLCEECRKLSDTFLHVQAAFGREESESDSHPPSETLVRYAVRPDALDTAERARVCSHLERCLNCAFEVEATQDAERELSALVPEPLAVPIRKETRHWSPAAAAACLVFLALAYPAFLGLFEMPRARQQLEDNRQQLSEMASWTGSVQLVVLQTPLRETDASVPTLGVTQDQPFVPIVVDPGTLGASTPETMSFAIHSSDGRPVWSRELTGDEVKRSIGISQVVTFLVPSAELPDGRYSLSVLDVWASGEEPRFDAGFRVERNPVAPYLQSPTATNAPQ